MMTYKQELKKLYEDIKEFIGSHDLEFSEREKESFIQVRGVIADYYMYEEEE